MKKKNKKKKGFTLIELLAVILILGIIALIAIPTVNNVIEEARKGASITTTQNIEDAINKQIVILQMNSDSAILDGYYTMDEIKNLGLDINNTDDVSGYVVIADGTVTKYDLNDNQYTVYKDGDSYTAEKYKVNLASNLYSINNEFDSYESRVQKNIVYATLEKDKKYHISFDVTLEVKGINPSTGWGDFSLWRWHVWGNTYLYRHRTYTAKDKEIGIFKEKVDVELTALKNVDNQEVIIYDTSNMKGTISLENIEIYEVE